MSHVGDKWIQRLCNKWIVYEIMAWGEHKTFTRTMLLKLYKRKMESWVIEFDNQNMFSNKRVYTAKMILRNSWSHFNLLPFVVLKQFSPSFMVSCQSFMYYAMSFYFDSCPIPFFYENWGLRFTASEFIKRKHWLHYTTHVKKRWYFFLSIKFFFFFF